MNEGQQPPGAGQGWQRREGSELEDLRVGEYRACVWPTAKGWAATLYPARTRAIQGPRDASKAAARVWCIEQLAEIATGLCEQAGKCMAEAAAIRQALASVAGEGGGAGT